MRALPRLRARAYAGSRRISSRLTFSPRTNPEASRRNGYFARRARSTASGTRGAIKAHGGDAHEVALVRPGHRGPDDDLVAFADDVVDRRLAVGERRAEHREPLLLALPARRHPGRRRVVHVILGGRLVNHKKIPSVQDFVVKHLHRRLVLLHAHLYSLRWSPGGL